MFWSLYMMLQENGVVNILNVGRMSGMKKNTMSMKKFIFEHAFYGYLSFCCFYGALFHCLQGWSMQASVILLGFIFVFVSLSGMLLYQATSHRNGISIAKNVFSTWFIYSSIAWMPYCDELIKKILFCVAFAIMVATIIIFLINRGKSIILKMKKIVSCAASVLMVAMLTAQLFVNYNLLIGSVHSDPTAANSLILSDDDTFSDMEDAKNLLLFSDEKWDKLSTSEKIDALQMIVETERVYLGLTYNITVMAISTNRNIYGCYSPTTSTIRINIETLKDGSAELLLSIVLHEIQHAYQQEQIDLYNSLDGSQYQNLRMWDNVKRYKYENEHYMNENFDYAYASQLIEKESEEYSHQRIQYYMKIINKL